tara:strand:+ start:979 stop:1278 length:300 start_codon:yes stop_codon:yes gene_type:complete
MGNQVRIAEIKPTSKPEWTTVVFTTDVEEGSLMGIIARADFKVATAYECVATDIAETLEVGQVFPGYTILKEESDEPFYQDQAKFAKTGKYHRSRVIKA